MKPERIGEIVERYDAMTDVFILCVDRDGAEGRTARETRQTRSAVSESSESSTLRTPGKSSRPGVLAGLKLPAKWRWDDVRAEVSVKERYFDVLAKRRGVLDAPGAGRKPLAEEAARHVPAIRQKCIDDFDALARRIEALD